MADRGNVGLYMQTGAMLLNRSGLTLGVQPTGNGPIQPSAPFVATPGSIAILLGRRGARMDADRDSGPSGVWDFYDLSPGRYFVSEAGSSRQWQIDVAADLSFTVTPVTSSFPRTRAYASA